MKNVCLLISMIVLCLSTEIKAQNKKESIVTIEMYATKGVVGDYYKKRHEPFVIQTIDNQLSITEKTFNPSKNDPINHLLEFRKEIDFWTNQGYRLLSIEMTTKPNETYFYFFATMVKDE